MESNKNLDYMSQDIIEKAEEFDKEYKIQKENLRIKKESQNEESSDEEQQVKIILIYHYLK